MDVWLIQEGLMFTLYSLGTTEIVGDFLKKLEKEEPQEARRLLRRLEQLANSGSRRRDDEFNSLGEGIYEAKAHSGARVAFFYDQNHVVICALAFMKKTNRISAKDLEAIRQQKRIYDDAKMRDVSPTVHLLSSQSKSGRKPSWWK